MYDYVIVTHIPAFYKINLYNELSKHLKIYVIFIASNTNEKRANDFTDTKTTNFEFVVLSDGNFQNRNIIENILKLRCILRHIDYKKLLVNGWDLMEFWYLVFATSKSKNCLALESTINESKIGGLRRFLKEIFLKRISLVFVPGKLHKELLNVLNYKNEIKITKGVGIINKPRYEPISRNYRKRFLFIGRLSKEKNVNFLVDIFNNLNDYTLTIIGTGPLEKELRNKAKSNISFLGQINNNVLKEHFFNNDILILPSIKETWGLVVEEALFFGMPVIVSSSCGVCELIKNGVNGFIIENNILNIKETIIAINKELYETLANGVKIDCIENKDKMQISAYEI